jgi:hypothetical protein
MHIPFSSKNADRIHNKKSRHQKRRQQRMIDESKRDFDNRFGVQQHFGRRGRTRLDQTAPERTFGKR